MANYTNRELERGQRILNALFKGERRTDEIEEGASIVDIEASSRQFVTELDALSALGRDDFPAVTLGDGELVPMSFLDSLFQLWRPTSGVLPLHGLGRPLPFLTAYVHDMMRDWDMFMGDRPRLPRNAARETFLTRASRFLATRFAGVRARRREGFSGAPGAVLNMAQYAGGPPTSVVGCHFHVHTNSPGLTAHWSGAYYVTPNYLGAPTTPAIGVLQAGTYVFGVTGGAYGGTVQWDTNSVCTLPGAPSVHLYY
ncbi:MAG: hypothetical protein C3F17_16905 [Bradyrhizobiaceae bacterium]|nr:MAG: hypothetical protein C3F17_16905 [Bradyrhizobiaceae bacterium]